MKKILIGLLVGVVFFALAFYFFKMQHAILIGLIAFLVALWTNQALPLGIVSLLPILLFPAFGIIDVKTVVPNYSKSIIFLFLGGFMLAIALQKIELHKYLSKKLLLLFPHTPRGIVYALAITSALLSSILSNTTITLMLMPIGLFLTENLKLKVRFLIAIAYGASIGGIITPIGTPPNMILLGFLESWHLAVPTFGEWMIQVAPIALLMLVSVPYILSIGLKDEVLEPLTTEILVLNKEQKRLLWILGTLVLLLIVNTPIKPYYMGLGLNEKLILLGYGMLMFVPKIGFLEWEDTNKIPYEIVFLFGAGFSIATAFTQTQLASEIAHRLDFLLDMPMILLFLFIALFVSFSTEITSNTALTSIVLPIFYELSINMGESAMVVLMVATISASYAFMLPIATPPNAIIMSSRVIEIKEMAKFGFFINLLGVIFVTIVAYFLWL
ncbi:Sodium-dependent transporter [hydrothermal vent metagenome]|uniref:Sodium-dependent transporter n=1 Tax=hydrothermal vent metagenome TaxID=652676 RepID=A0A1W1D4F0_9ZZZZ